MKRERLEEVAEILDKRGKMTLEQLEEAFPEVSQMTLRRDLSQLEEDGRIIRIRGGAMSVKEVQKVSGEAYTKKTTINMDAKIVIAQKAATLIDEGTSIYGRRYNGYVPFKGNARHKVQHLHQRHSRCNGACAEEECRDNRCRRTAYEGQSFHLFARGKGIFQQYQL